MVPYMIINYKKFVQGRKLEHTVTKQINTNYSNSLNYKTNDGAKIFSHGCRILLQHSLSKFMSYKYKPLRGSRVYLLHIRSQYVISHLQCYFVNFITP